MATRNLPLPNQLSINTSYEQTSRTSLLEFGDGYIQRTPQGINARVRSIVVSHEALDPTDAATVLAVYDISQSSGDSVTIAGNELMDLGGTFYITDISVELVDNDRRNIVANMREVFDL